MSNKVNDQTGAENIQWDLSDLYASVDDPALQSDIRRVEKLTREYASSYKGKIREFDEGRLKQALQEYEDILELLGKIGSYARLLWSTDTSNAGYGKLVQQASELSSDIHQQLVFFDVEWLALDDEKARRLIESEELKHYKHHLETSRRYKPHILDEKAEQVLSAKKVTGSSAWNRYFDETMGAARFTLDGEELTQQEVLSKLYESDRELRKRAHASLTETFSELSRSLTFIFNTLLADKHTDDRQRNYSSWISSRNLSNEVDDVTVAILIDSVTDRYDLVHRFCELKRSLLDYDELFDYDRYAPLLENEKEIQWESARNTVLDSYSDFHPEMGRIAGKFFERQWIDAAIKPGKRGGAYSAGTVPSAHPYVFMNFNGKIRDVQTLAHELGHGVHQYLSRGQGVLQAGTPLTTAETASVFGEMLVFQRMMRREEDPKTRLAMLSGKIDDTIATVFRQVAMNRFEDQIHNERRTSGELPAERFSDVWMETQNDMFKGSVTLGEHYRHWWSYIPHFLHSPGYVYAYAFGELLVFALYARYQQVGESFAEDYIGLLESGGSDWPHVLVGKLGVDLTDLSFWVKGMLEIEKLIEQAEALS